MTCIRTLACASAIAIAASCAGAATIDFENASPGTHTNYVEDGFVFDKLRIVRGACANNPTKPCGAENAFRDSTMTRVNGGVFDVKNLWFNIVNPAAPLTLVTDRGEATFSVGAFIDQVLIEQGKGYTLDLTSYAIFKDVSFLKIVDITLGQAGTGHGKGNLRFDNIELAVMPVPGAGILLLAGLGGLAALRRRQRA